MDLIVIIFGIIYAVKRHRVNGLAQNSFPGVSQENFEKWKRLELRRIDVFLWIVWLWIGFELLIIFPLYVISREDWVLYPALFSSLPVLIIAFIVLSIKGKKAKLLKKSFKENGSLVTSHWKWGAFVVQSILSGLVATAFVGVFIAISYFFYQDKTNLDENFIKNALRFTEGAFLFGLSVVSWKYTHTFVSKAFNLPDIKHEEMLKLTGGLAYLWRPVALTLFVSFLILPWNFSGTFFWDFGPDEGMSSCISGALFSFAGFWASSWLPRTKLI